MSMISILQLILDQHRTVIGLIPSENVGSELLDGHLDTVKVQLNSNDARKTFQIIGQPRSKVTSLVWPGFSQIHVFQLTELHSITPSSQRLGNEHPFTQVAHEIAPGT